MNSVYDNPEYVAWFNNNIYNLAKAYAKNHPIHGMEREDYLQELVARVWRALPTYNPKKSALSTFAYTWFGSKHDELIRRIMPRQEAFGVIASLDDEITESGCVLSDTIYDEVPTYDVYDAKTAYETLCVESRMYYEGYTLCQISHELSKPMALVQEAIDADVTRLREAFGA